MVPDRRCLRVMDNIGNMIEILESEEVKQCRKKIVEMVGQIEDEKFLNQIRIILKRHIEKRGS